MHESTPARGPGALGYAYGVLMLAFGCVTDPAPEEYTGREEIPGDLDPDSAIEDSAEDSAVEPADCGQVPEDSAAYAALFNPAIVHSVSLSVTTEDRARLLAAPDEWAPAALVVDGVELASIGVKWRGDSTQMRWEAKPSWSVGLRRGSACDTLAGIERFSLDAMIDDPAQARLVLESALLEGLDRVVPRAVFATLAVDGEDFGLYALIEVVDAPFVVNHLGAWPGVVWQGGSGADFTTTGLAAWDDVDGLGDLGRLEAVAMIVQGSGDAFYEDLGSVLDTADFAAHWGALAAVGDAGSFPFETDDVNVLVPDAGLIRLVPDAPESGWNAAFHWKYVDAALGVRCVYDASCVAAVGTAVGAAATAVEALDGEASAQAAFDLSESAVASDPRRETRANEVTAARAALAASVKAWPGLLQAQAP